MQGNAYLQKRQSDVTPNLRSVPVAFHRRELLANWRDDRITIPCNQYTYGRGDKPDCFYQYADHLEYTACLNCAKCRAFCKEQLNYKFGDCAWDPLPATEPHLSRLACGDLYKCICS